MADNENQDLWDRFFGGDGKPAVIQDGKLYLEVTELLLNTKVSRGEYNRNQVYGHLKVEPAVPWLVAIPVGEAQDLDALKMALDAFQGLVTDVVRQKATELERLDKEELRAGATRTVSGGNGRRYGTGVSVTTPVRTIEAGEPGRRPSMEAATGEEPADQEEDF